MLDQTHDVVMRYVRVQHGKGPQKPRPDDGGDCIAVYDSHNFIIDHCSTHWGTDETLSVSGAVDLYTVQWCIISEGLNYEKHSMSSILCGERCTWHHNLFAHAGSRNPLFAGQPRCDFRNNVIYNWGHTSGQGNFTQLNYVGNYLRPGPSTVPQALRFLATESVALPASLYLVGNVLDGFPEISKDNWLGAIRPRVPQRRTISNAARARRVRGKRRPTSAERRSATLPRRDAPDARVIADGQDRTGKIIASQQEIGGWPEFVASTAAPIDGDHDGIPDQWERRQGLNPNEPSDAQTVAADGYTWLENYLSQLAR